jgi:hypothetical protein
MEEVVEVVFLSREILWGLRRVVSGQTNLLLSPDATCGESNTACL